MAKKNKKDNKKGEGKNYPKPSPLHPEAKQSIWSIVFIALTVIFLLSALKLAGPWGNGIFEFFTTLFGIGYYLLPAMSLLISLTLLSKNKKEFLGVSLIGALIFIFSSLGLIDIINAGSGGVIGKIAGVIKNPFSVPGGIVITLALMTISFVMIINKPLRFPERKESSESADRETEREPEEIRITAPAEMPEETKEEKKSKEKQKEKEAEIKSADGKVPELKTTAFKPIKNYVSPPLNLLTSQVDKPTIGDLRANANVIKRTLESFGIPVEMGEINVGPTVTRYTLKPAEGIKLSRITSLNQDLALALAAHPIRIEAPIPGKSLVGIEVPNRSAAVVRLGSLLLYPDFQKAGVLSFALGRNVSGEPIFKDVSKMPHLLIAGATGSGKSIMIHSLILSLLYKNSPEMLRLIMIDPKRVELSVYDGIPHLLAPVITENKKSIGVLRWAIQEMESRYQTLLEAGARDIKSYNTNSGKMIPYIVIVIDELADLMTSYGREVEGSIIRLAQMARATGLHLIVSTQRPSVEVITGLIKANITSRIALQVASQIDSRTILDTPGAEKLLGNGDALFISAELSKPLRVQGAFVSEEEIKKVANFIKKNNESAAEELSFNGSGGGEEAGRQSNLDFDALAESGDDDELLDEAIETVRNAKKASASLLQRRLKVGYARAARLLDMMEERGIIGPGEGAKPREVFYNNDDAGE